MIPLPGATHRLLCSISPRHSAPSLCFLLVATTAFSSIKPSSPSYSRLVIFPPSLLAQPASALCPPPQSGQSRRRQRNKNGQALPSA
ncbi:unnamed protein product [Linum trigynum]|uniref:Secreted protein n=1 Tax=Linum trigynum TaxID=586398 RepID=A0AAV2GCT1_9ROSI